MAIVFMYGLIIKWENKIITLPVKGTTETGNGNCSHIPQKKRLFVFG
jgi:hypothetical protein